MSLYRAVDTARSVIDWPRLERIDYRIRLRIQPGGESRAREVRRGAQARAEIDAAQGSARGVSEAYDL